MVSCGRHSKTLGAIHLEENFKSGETLSKPGFNGLPTSEDATTALSNTSWNGCPAAKWEGAEDG